ncbi:uncharacterized protein LOC134242732 isoform X2 [Saccostrea cucullata]|uniref:uncharacterized protein LOC134242732 isoform X2 n=1 Tax=Saccostrea cuccullata TaxID=36930 RepID=UPI002ED62D2C
MRRNVNIVAYGKTISGLYPYYALSDWDCFPRGAPTAASVLQIAISTPLFDLNMADKARDFAFRDAPDFKPCARSPTDLYHQLVILPPPQRVKLHLHESPQLPV